MRIFKNSNDEGARDRDLLRVPGSASVTFDWNGKDAKIISWKLPRAFSIMTKEAQRVAVYMAVMSSEGLWNDWDHQNELRPGRWRLSMTDGLSLDVDRTDSWSEPAVHLSANDGKFEKVAHGTIAAKRPASRVRRIRPHKILD